MTNLVCKFYPNLSSSSPSSSVAKTPSSIRFHLVQVRFLPSTNRGTRRTLKNMNQTASTESPRNPGLLLGDKKWHDMTYSRICGGFCLMDDKDSIIMTNVAAALEKEGITAFRFDFSGNGESEGTFQYGGAVIQHFKNENSVTSAILGHSRGGDVVFLYASKYHDIGTVVNTSGRYDLKKGIVERMGKNFFERIKKDGYFDVKN